VRLVDDNVIERELLEGALLDETNLIRRHADLKVLRDEAGRDGLRTLLLSAAKDDDVHVRRPLPELVSPVLEGGLGNDDEVGRRDVAVVFEVGEKGDCLKSFAEALKLEVRLVIAWKEVREEASKTYHSVCEEAMELVTAHLAVNN